MIDTTEQGASSPAPAEKPKKKQRRFTTREQIIDAMKGIDGDNEKDNIDAEVYDAIADLIRDKFQDDKFIRWKLQITDYRDRADRCRDRSERRTRKKMPQLKKALGAFQTTVLSIELVGGDTSVPAP